MPREDAGYSASCMVQTNLWGIDSHGVLRLPIYAARLAKKAVNPNPAMKVLSGENAAVGMLDGDAGLGYVVARAGMRLAMEKAGRFGVGLTLATNSNHFGAAALFTKLAADADMLGLAATNVIPNIGMRGACKPITGNNPVALAAPIPGRPPFCLDISMSAVAGGKLLLAAKKGEKIPFDWAVTKEGRDTDDPKLGFEGILLPLGMHKGFGLSLFIDIITGVLGGGFFLDRLKSMYKHPDEPSGTTHIFIALDPGFFMDRKEFGARMADWANRVKAAPLREGTPALRIPGEIEATVEADRLANGIPVPDELYADLGRLAKEYGLPPLAS